MMKKLIILIGLILFLQNFSFAFAQIVTPSPTPPSNQNVQDLQNKINDLQNKINDLKGQEKTLSDQISVFDNQIKLTTYKIEQAKQQVADLTLDIDTASKKIENIQSSIENLTKVLVNRIIATYEIGSAPSFQILLSSNNVSDFVNRANYLKLAQAHDKRLIYDTVQAKNDYANQKEIFEEEKNKVQALNIQLQAYNNQLAQDKSSKQTLLRETQGSESVYQQQLAQAKAEYEALVGIVAGKGTETVLREVNQGDVIATIISGKSCNSSGTHLHFTVSQGGSAQNPFNFLKSVDHVNQSGGDPFNPSGSWDWPISSPIEYNQGFGSDTAYIRATHYYPTHNGIDISSSSLTVRAVKPGTLYRGSYAGYNGCSLPYVRVHHSNDGLDTFYLHTYSN